MPLGKPLLDLLERMSCGGVVLDALGNVLRVNRSAASVFKELRLCEGKEISGRVIKKLLADSRRLTLDENTWSHVQRNGRRQLLVHAVQLDERTVDRSDSIVILIDLGTTPIINHSALQGLFELTATEASLAADIATGKPLAKIAEARRVSITTARTQLASIFGKTHTRRQAELVALLTRISILPFTPSELSGRARSITDAAVSSVASTAA